MVFMGMGIRCHQRKESDKKSTVAIDLAKSVFQLAVADASWKGIETHRLTRSQFERWFLNRDVSLVVMESCGSAHHWARHLSGLGIEVKLLPAKYVRAFVLCFFFVVVVVVVLLVVVCVFV